MHRGKIGSLKGYITLACKLYGESKPEEYVEEVINNNLNNLDGAIDCFKSLCPQEEKKAPILKEPFAKKYAPTKLTPLKK